MTPAAAGVKAAEEADEDAERASGREREENARDEEPGIEGGVS
jgi:hypothetical protein